MLAECFSGLLTAAPERSLRLVEGFVDSEDIAVAEAALLALGASRLAAAFDLLKARWETAASPLRKTVLLAIAMVRSDCAIEFLLALLAECSVATAKDVLAAFALFRDNEKTRNRVESVVASRNENSVSKIFEQQF